MRHCSTFFYPCFLALITALCTPASADGIEPLTDILNTPGSAGAGLSLRISPSPYLQGGTRADLTPLYLYEGERVYLHANRAGVKLIKEGSGAAGPRVDVFIEPRLEGFPAGNLPDSVVGMGDHKPGVDVGLALRLSQSWGTVRAELVQDVGGASRGYEARLGYGFEWRSGRWSLRPDVSLSWRDAKLNNYYYGVQANEATADRPAYAPGGSAQAQIGLYGSYDVSERWRLLAGVSATVLGSSVKNSPIVQKRVLPAVYVGAAYDFGAPQRPPGQTSSPTYVKLLYGKATEDGCHLIRIITARCLRTDQTTPTSISGIQIGKPFAEKFNDWPLDLVGYVGLTHHNENGRQANGFQVDVFMKGYYYGFPWSERVKTRLGLGVGLSAARRAPFAEVNAEVGSPTSRVMQYLDPTIDFSLGDAIGVRSLKDTFIGFGVSHRSGVFGSSRLLGNVNGGSNYIYSYVESAF